MNKIIIAENIPSLNKGELALLNGILNSLNLIGSHEVSIISSNLKIDQERYPSDLNILDVSDTFHIKYDSKSKLRAILSSSIMTLKHILFLILIKLIGKKALILMKSDIWKHYLNSDAILVGHNGIFGIGSGLIGNISLFMTSMSYIYLPFFGRTLKKPLIIYGGSVPLYNSFLKRFWMSFLLNRIDLITLRESKSYENLRKNGCNQKNAVITTDLAFLMDEGNEKDLKKIITNEKIEKSDKPLIGFTFTRYKGITAYKHLSNKESFEKHITLLAEFIDYLIENQNAKIVFLPHSIGFEKKFDDRIIARSIYEKCNHQDRIKLIENEYSVQELKSVMGILDLFIGERLHSVINAMSMCVPSMVLSNINDQRLEIIREIGQEPSICFVDDLKTEDLISKFNEIWENRKDIQEQLKKQIPVMKKRSFENAKLLKNLLDNQDKRL